MDNHFQTTSSKKNHGNKDPILSDTVATVLLPFIREPQALALSLPTFTFRLVSSRLVSPLHQKKQIKHPSLTQTPSRGALTTSNQATRKRDRRLGELGFAP
jgi:hypothetical protein